MNLTGADMQIQELRDRLAAAQARIQELENDWIDNRDVLLQAAMVMDAAEGFKRRAEAAEADAETANHYAKRALTAEARVKELEALLEQVNEYGEDCQHKFVTFQQWLELGASEV